MFLKERLIIKYALSGVASVWPDTPVSQFIVYIGVTYK